MGWRAEPAQSVNRRRRTGDGAPYGVWEGVSVKPASSVIRRKGRRGRRPLRVVRVDTFQRSREVRFIKPVTLYAARPVSLLHVGCTVLGAPWSRDRRGNVGADGRRDQLQPRLPRCASLCPQPNVCNFAGTARAPLVGVRELLQLPYTLQRSSHTHRRGRRPRRPLRRMIAGAG